MNKIAKLLALIVATIIISPTFALAATMQTGDNVSINKGSEIKDNVYAAGANVAVNSAILGDLIVAGGSIIVTDDIAEDITAAGGQITILGNTGGDVRVAGGNILIAGNVAGDLIVAGGTVTVAKGVSVGKDLVAAGGQIIIDGNVIGHAQIAGGIATINGYIHGGVNAEVGEKLIIGDKSIIVGGVTYNAKNADALTIVDGAQMMGETIFNQTMVPKAVGTKNFLWAAVGTLALIKLISLIIAALIFVGLFGKFSNSLATSVIKDPLPMLGKGFVALVIIPAAMIILFLTIFGIPLGILVMTLYVALIIVASVYTGILLGAWGEQTWREAANTVVTWQNVIVGTIALAIVTFIPFIGWVISLAIFLVTLGGIVDSLHKKLWLKR